MKERHIKYKKQVDGCISATEIYVGFILLLEFIIKGSVDLYTSGRYLWLSYLQKASINILLGVLFFAVILLIDCLIAKKRHKR